MKNLSNTQAKMKKSVAYKEKACKSKGINIFGKSYSKEYITIMTFINILLNVSFSEVPMNLKSFNNVVKLFPCTTSR